MERCTGPGSPGLALAESGAASFTLDPGGQQQVLPRLFHHPASTCGLPARRAGRGPRLARRSPLHVPLHPKSLRGPRWAPSSRRNARGALHRCPVWSPGSSRPRARTHLPVFCRDRRPFCWEPLSWRPSGGLVASVPRAGWKVANAKARVMNWPSRAAHMVLRGNPPPRDLESGALLAPLLLRCFPSSSHPPSLLAFSLLLLLAAAARIEVTQRPPVALRRACDQAVSSAASAGQWQGWCLKYPWKLWCHLNEGVEQVLSRRLDQSETPARLTTRPGGGACAQLLREGVARRSCRPGGGHTFACVCVSV